MTVQPKQSFHALVHLREFSVARNRFILKNYAAFAIALVPASFTLAYIGPYKEGFDLLLWLSVLWGVPELITRRINTRIILDQRGLVLKTPILFIRKPRQTILIPWDEMDVCTLLRQKGDIAAYTLYIESGSKSFTVKFLQLSLAYLFVNKGKLLTVLRKYAPEAQIKI